MQFKLILVLIWSISVVAFQPVDRRCDFCKHKSHCPKEHHSHTCHDGFCSHHHMGLFNPASTNHHCKHCGLFGLPHSAFPNYDNRVMGIFNCNHKKPKFLGLPIHLPSITKTGLGGYIALPGHFSGFKVDLFKIENVK